MNQSELAAMSNRDLKRHIVKHPEDQAAFRLLMDRRHARTDLVTIEPDDPNWGEKFMALIEKQLAEAKNNP
jgi:low affinity Fe/Cu permease